MVSAAVYCSNGFLDTADKLNWTELNWTELELTELNWTELNKLALRSVLLTIIDILACQSVKWHRNFYDVTHDRDADMTTEVEDSR